VTGHLRAIRAGAAGLAVVAVGAFAHAAGGGHVPWRPALAAFVVVTALAAQVQRWTFWRAALLTAFAQPALHFAFGAGAGHAHHGHDAHHMSGVMPWAHMVAALVTAVALRWGVRWLQALPAVARALVVPPRRLTLPIVAPAWPAPAPVFAVRPAFARVPSTRGPPR